MGMLIDGVWDEHATGIPGKSGAFNRVQSTFRQQITADGRSGFKAEADRYHLYLSFACPWCHRVMIFLKLKKLENVISTSYVHPVAGERGWYFQSQDPLLGIRFIYDVYRKAVPDFTGRCTVPILWDKKTNAIVNNESSDIIRMLNREFAAFTDDQTDYYPVALAPQIDAVNERIYHNVNNGVYRCGFAALQEPYEEAVRDVFQTLDWIEAILSSHSFLLGEQLTEADWRLFPTLVRFDCAYYPLFKCNLRHVYEYPAIWRLARKLFAMPGIADTVDVQTFKESYFGIKILNPSGIVPLGPRIEFNQA